MNRRDFQSLLLAGALISLVRPSAGTPTPKLLFVHGRGQAGLDSHELEATWLSTLKKGAMAVGRKLPDTLEVSFPFYGDLLETFVQGADLPLTPDLEARGGTGEDAEFLAFQAEVAEDIRQKTGITDEQIMREYEEAGGEQDDTVPRGPQNWKWVRAIIAAVDKHATGVSSSAIEQRMRDVFLYTTRPYVRDAVDEVVRNALTASPTVVVGHSLGSVVAYNVLRNRTGDGLVPLFVTVGSPLGIRAIKNQLLPISFPKNVTSWFNAFDRRDVVALFPLDGDNFEVDPAISNFDGVRNSTDNRHGIVGYLDDKEVASHLLDAL